MADSPALTVTQVHPIAGVIDLGVGQPQDAMLPVALIGRAMVAAASAGSSHPLQYGQERGDERLRARLAQFLAGQYGMAMAVDQLLISNGNSQAIELCCAAFTSPGDVVFVEEPTYFLALQIFRDHGLHIVGIPVDDDGLRIDALEAALADHSPRLVYAIPTGQNPTGSSMPSERRRRLVELAAERGFLVVADEVYQMLDYSGSAPEPLSAYVDSGVVLSLGTFSKILAPGLRLGWIHAREDLLEVLAGRGQLISGGGLNPLISAIVTPLLDDGSVDAYLEDLRVSLNRRRAAMDGALAAHIPTGATYRCPRAGYFFWLKFPDHVDTAARRPAALAAGVGFLPGPVFSTSDAQTNCLRLSFSFYAEADIRHAVSVLCHTFDTTR